MRSLVLYTTGARDPDHDGRPYRPSLSEPNVRKVGFRAVLIIELSDGEAAAAWAGRVLGWCGAEVVKVESPGRSVPDRALDLYLNHGKRRLSLDYRDPSDRAAIDAMAAEADVVITDAAAGDVSSFDLLALGGSTGVRASIRAYSGWRPAPVAGEHTGEVLRSSSAGPGGRDRRA